MGYNFRMFTIFIGATVLLMGRYLLRATVRRMGRKKVPHDKDNNPFGTANTVSLYFDEE